jgi:hypothetical protein
MQTKEKLNKAIWQHFEGMRDLVMQNVVTMIRDGKLKVEPAELGNLTNILKTSMEDGFHRGHSVLDREINAVLGEVPVVKATTKKK